MAATSHDQRLILRVLGNGPATCDQIRALIKGRAESRQPMHSLRALVQKGDVVRRTAWGWNARSGRFESDPLHYVARSAPAEDGRDTALQHIEAHIRRGDPEWTCACYVCHRRRTAPESRPQDWNKQLVAIDQAVG